MNTVNWGAVLGGVYGALQPAAVPADMAFAGRKPRK